MLDDPMMPRAMPRLEHGMIIAPSNMELVVNDHCNIACRQCNHASPVMKKWNTDPETTQATLGRLATIYRCDRLRILGGEPLLHPNLTELIAIAKQSGIGKKVQLTTNGMLLDRLSDEAWQTLDEIELSVYKMANLTNDTIKSYQRKGEKFGTRVQPSHYDDFRMTFSTKGTQDQDLVNDIWKGCKMMNVWACHSVRGTHIYRCPQSIYAMSLTGRSMTEEGFDILNAADLRDGLMGFLGGAGPLKSCHYCVGSCGKKFAQNGLDRKSWKTDLDKPLEEMVDYELLERSKREANPVDDCRQPVKIRRGLVGKVQRRLNRLF